MCSDIKKHFVACQHPCPSLVQDDLDGFRRYETPASHDQFSATRRILLQVRRNLTLHHLALAPTDRCHIDGDGPGHHSVVGTVTRKMRNFRIRNLILARHASDVGTGATYPASLHDGGPAPGLRQVPSYEFAANSAAKDENFKPLWLRHSIFSVCEVQYLASMWKCLFPSDNTLSTECAQPLLSQHRHMYLLPTEP